MDKIFNYLLFSLAIFCFKNSYSQMDTVTFNNQIQFNECIYRCFRDYTRHLDASIQKKIDSVYQTYDFTGDEYDCQYRFSFLVELDSCGKIIRCNPGNNKKFGQLEKFEKEVSILVEESNALFNNVVSYGDTSYIMDKTLFIFEIACDPYEVIYDYLDLVILKNVVNILEVDGEKKIFDGFKLAKCDD